MRRADRKKWIVRSVLALLLLATTVLAQPAPDVGAPPATAAAPKQDDAIMNFEKASLMSAEQQLAQAQDYISKMKDIKNKVKVLAEKARTDKDIIKLNCVNDKLIQIDGHLKLSGANLTALKQASQQQDAAGRAHEFIKITISYQKVVVLGQEAEACIGEDIAYTGDTEVATETDPDIPEEDPTLEPPPELPIVRPPFASPYL